MRRLLLCCLLNLAPVCAQAATPEGWTQFYRDNAEQNSWAPGAGAMDGIFGIRMRTEYTSIQFVFDERETEKNLLRYDSDEQDLQFNCGAGTFRTVAEQDYLGGDLILTRTFADAEWRPVARGSILDKLKHIACAAAAH